MNMLEMEKTVKLSEIPLTEMKDIGVFLNMLQSEINTLAIMQEKLVSLRFASEVCKNTTENRQWGHLYLQERLI